MSDHPHNTNFYPRSPCGERRKPRALKSRRCVFLSTLSLRRATTVLLIQPTRKQISIHALLAESDPYFIRYIGSDRAFLSTLSLRRATGQGANSHGGRQFLSTLSLRRATVLRKVPILGIKYFYPRSPCGERRLELFLYYQGNRFLSTLSLRRATWSGSQQPRGTTNFYPRSPCGERPAKYTDTARLMRFLSTLSLRRATTWARGSRVTYVISIHALLAESDHYDNYNLHCVEISIHALLAESDPHEQKTKGLHSAFLSTLSLRRATHLFASSGVDFSISIHALLAESDSERFCDALEHLHFYPRSPCGERPPSANVKPSP